MRPLRKIVLTFKEVVTPRLRTSDVDALKEWKRQETVYSMCAKMLFHNFSFSSYLPQSYEYKVGRAHDLDHTNISNF